MGPPRVGVPRRQWLLWTVMFGFTAAAGGLLFFSGPLFLRAHGARAMLLRRAAGLRGRPAAEVSARVGAILKDYLDASRPTSRAEVRIVRAGAGRLEVRVLLPWAEVSEKKRRQRAAQVARLAADMLQGAGAESVAVAVRLRRRRRLDPARSDPAGSYLLRPGGGLQWRPARGG